MKSKAARKKSVAKGAKAKPKARAKSAAKATRKTAKTKPGPARKAKAAAQRKAAAPKRRTTVARTKKGRGAMRSLPQKGRPAVALGREAQRPRLDPLVVPAETARSAPAQARYAGPVKRVKLPEGYRPSEDEAFMNPYQAEYFRQKLLAWRGELLDESQQTLAHLKESIAVSADLADRAMIESERAVELRTRDRERKLIAKIDAALRRIDEGTYGYCEVTGQPIGLKRLEARPIATLSIEAQERHERMEKIYRED